MDLFRGVQTALCEITDDCQPVPSYSHFPLFFHISSSNQQSKPWYRKNAPAGENERARKAYRVLMTVTLRKPDSEEYLRFANEVQDRAKTHYNYEYASQEVSWHLLIGSLLLSQWMTSGLSIGPCSFSQWLASGLF